MGIKITKNTLGNFQNKILNQDFDSLVNNLANAIAERGVEIAKEKFGSESVQVYKTEANNGTASIIASGKQVAYIEFGTGIMGDGTYPGKLPPKSRTIKFYSRGNNQETKGWEYNYFKKQHMKSANVKDWKGHQAFAPMFYTGRQLRQEIPQIVKDTIKGDR